MINKKELLETIDDLRKQHNIPSVQVGIIKNNETVFCGGTGFRDLDSRLLSNTETVFPIASDTKAFVAEAIAILVDEGKVEWDKPIKYYIPDFKMHDNYATENLTVRDMLCHRCGLPGHGFMLMLNMKDYSKNHILESLEYLKPNAPIRYKMQYQNHMYGIAGTLIERVTGQKWNEFIDERILQPLGMINTCFSVKEITKLENKALPYEYRNGSINEISYDDISQVMGSAGSMNSNIKDMLKWIQFNIDKGQWKEQKIISKDNIEECHSPQMILGDFPCWNFEEIDFQNYGMGWFMESYRGHKVIHHSGSIAGFISMVSFIPEINAGFVILTNRDANRIGNILQYSFYDILFGFEKIDWNEKFKEVINKTEDEYNKHSNIIKNSVPKNTLPSYELHMYAGEYYHNAYGKISILHENNKLIFQSSGVTYTLEHLCFDSFILEDKTMFLLIPFQFKIDTRGKIISLELECEPELKDMIEFTKLTTE